MCEQNGKRSWKHIAQNNSINIFNKLIICPVKNLKRILIILRDMNPLEISKKNLTPEFYEFRIKETKYA